MQNVRQCVHVSALDCKESFMLFRSRTEILFIIMLKLSMARELRNTIVTWNSATATSRSAASNGTSSCHGSTKTERMVARDNNYANESEGDKDAATMR